MTTTRGRKNPDLLVERKPEESDGTLLVTGRPLRVGKDLLPAGVVVPGAASWPRLDAWISTRYIKRISPSAEHVTYEDFLARLAGEEAERALIEAVVIELDPEAPAEPETPDEVPESKE